MAEFQKRKKLLINKEFQIKFILKIYMAVFIAIASLGIILFFFNDNKLSQSAYQQILNLKSARDLLIPTIFISGIITCVTTFLIVFYQFIRESHKIAGPMFRFEKIFKEVEYGDLTTFIKLRENDTMQEQAEQFNRMILSLNLKISTTKKTVERLKQIVSDNNNGDTSKVEKVVIELEENLDKIKTNN